MTLPVKKPIKLNQEAASNSAHVWLCVKTKKTNLTEVI